VNIIRRGLALVDELIVAVSHNPQKTAMFSLDERMDLVRRVFHNEQRLRVVTFEGLLIDYCRNNNISVILRGIRAVADFEFEYQMANMNRTLAPSVETAFLMADPATFYVSSRLVKEVASLGGDISAVVPPLVRDAVRQKLSLKKGPSA
jgi:pantetheine-phosphate adenylyltransferase